MAKGKQAGTGCQARAVKETEDPEASATVQPRMGLNAGMSMRGGCGDPGSGCSISSHEEGGCNGPDILVVKEKPDSGSSRQNLPNGKCQIN